MSLDDMLWIDNIDDEESVEAALAAIPRTKEGLNDLCSFLTTSVDYFTVGWTLLFDEFSELMAQERYQKMYAALKKQYTRFELRNQFYHTIPEIEAEDRTLVSKFPVTEEGFDQLFAFLKKESNCLLGWGRLFSAPFEKFRTEEKQSVILQFLLNTGDYEIIAAALGTEDAAKICGIDLKGYWEYAELEGSDFEYPT